MKLIDISHTLNEQTPVFPGDDALSLIKVKSLETDFYAAFSLSSTLHTGTHIDMPMHLTCDQRTSADFSLEHFAGKGVLLDVRGQTEIAMDSSYEETVTEDSIVLLYTGFDKKYGTDEYFTGHPYVGAELGEFLLSKNIKMLGMDTPSPDHIPYTFHKSLLKQEIFVLENLTNLGALVGAGAFEVMAFPLKISAEASFVRAVCRLV